MITGLACMLGVAALWSFVPVLVKLLLPVVDPFTLAFLRLSQAVAVLLIVFWARGHRLRGIRLSGWHLLGGLGLGLNFALFALSLSYTAASVGVLVVQVQYVTLAVLAAVVLGERLGPIKIAGMVLVLAGIAAVVGLHADTARLLAPRYALGNFLMLLAGLGWGIYALANKALVRRAGTSSILLPMLGIGTAINGLLSATHFQLYAEPTWTTAGLLLAAGAVATGFSVILVAEGIKRLSAALVGTTTAVTPIAQIALAHWILAEPLSLDLAGGGLVVLAGVLCMVYAERVRGR